MSGLEAHGRAVLDLVARTRPEGGRRVVGIAGPPGSGKSTLAAHVVARLNAGAGAEADAEAGAGAAPRAALLPMDGFHLDNAELDARGLRAVKGAPETFDVAAFTALLRRLRAAEDDIRYPLFDRAADRTLPDAGRLAAETPIVVVEGNYLLLQDGAWAGLRPLFDATVLIAPPMEVLEARLIARWTGFGLPREEAVARARGNDLVNARRVLDGSAPADLVLPGGETSAPSGPAADAPRATDG
jgi:pantothenate kinase